MTKLTSKIHECLKNLKIKTPNCSKYKKQYYADYIELVALVSNDFVSKSDIMDRLLDEGSSTNFDNPNDGEIGSIEPQTNDKAEKNVNSYFEYIEIRKDVYKTSYPFDIDNIKGIKMVSKDTLTESQKLYIYLLLASSLNSFVKLKQFITDDFEKLSELALKAYLPQHAKVLNFGSRSTYKGNAKTKIEKLGKDINVYGIDRRLLKLIPSNSSKEEGLDIVGWIPLEDNNPNTIIIFGQCACGKDWFGKQIESKRYGKFYSHYLTPFLHTMFFPEDFHNDGGIFNLDIDLLDNIIFERRRLINLSDNDIFDHLISSKRIVDKCIEYQEDIV